MVRTIALFTGLALLLCGCGSPDDGPKAEQATNRFYALIAAKDYHTLYVETSPDFKANTAEALMTGLLTRIDRRMGACQAPVKSGSWSVNYNTGGEFRSQGYTRACANGPLNETVGVVIRGGEAKVVSYNADSPRLLTD